MCKWPSELSLLPPPPSCSQPTHRLRAFVVFVAVAAQPTEYRRQRQHDRNMRWPTRCGLRERGTEACRVMRLCDLRGAHPSISTHLAAPLSAPLAAPRCPSLCVFSSVSLQDPRPMRGFGSSSARDGSSGDLDTDKLLEDAMSTIQTGWSFFSRGQWAHMIFPPSLSSAHPHLLHGQLRKTTIQSSSHGLPR